jgi:dolichol-phosphate mannosyltransferase
MRNTIELSIIIPAFNEEGTIAELLKILNGELSNALVSRYEVIIVDDGSTDATKKKVEKQVKARTSVLVIHI